MFSSHIWKETQLSEVTTHLAEEVIIHNRPPYLRDEFELTYRPGD